MSSMLATPMLRSCVCMYVCVYICTPGTLGIDLTNVYFIASTITIMKGNESDKKT